MKKYIKTILITIMCIMFMIFLGNITEVNAAWLGFEKSTFTVDVNGGYPKGSDLLLGTNHVFCIQQGQAVDSGISYNVAYYVKIDGNTSTVYSGNSNADANKLGSVTDIVNGKFAAIVSCPDPGSDQVKDIFSDNQKEVYGIFPTWLNKHSSYITGVATNAGGYGTTTWDDWAYKYASQVQDASITNNADVNNMTKELYQANGETYIKVGPFNNTFFGNDLSCTVTNQDDNAVTVKYGKYEGNNFITYNTIGEASISGGDFYILVPADGSVRTIKNISFTASHTRNNIVTHLWILQSGTNQNIISTYSEEGSVPSSQTVDVGPIDLTGNLKIVKVNEDNNSVKLPGVGFKIKHKQTEKYINQSSEGSISYVDETQATEFITDANGEILIENLIVGDYVAYETKNPNYGYAMLDTEQNMAVVVSTTSTHTITNKQIYVKLSGYVWEDLPWEVGKEDTNNGLYKDFNEDQNDKRLQGITVQLLDANGNVIQSTITDEQGNYLFVDVDINKLGEYYIEFQYNGMCYQNVVSNEYDSKDSYVLDNEDDGVAYADKSNSNRAIEGENRNTFNEEYHTISYGASNAHELTYQTEQNQSKLLYRADGDTSKYIYGYSENTKPVSGVDEQYIIKANTYNTYDGYLNQIKSSDTIRKENIIEITNINLGIEKRKEIDLSVIKDLYSAKVTINNQEHVYNYADRFNPENYQERYTVEPKVKFGQEYGNISYTRALYPSDIYYEGDNGLKVEVIYKIGIKNTSSNLSAVINELTDYYDEKYENIIIGYEIDKDEEGNETGTVVPNENFVVSEPETVETYNKVKIECKDLVVTDKENCIYVQLEVRKDKIVEILGDNDEVVKLDNVVEISSYSIRDEENKKSYAAIDIDSQPGNVDIGNIDTYEDDTDKAPGLKLVLQEERKISGQVFVDNTTEELISGQVRQGDGAYTEEDINTIAGVEVKLIDGKNNIVLVYDPDKKKSGEDEDGWIEAKTTTGKNGEFTIGGFIPDTYRVVYTWGDKEHTVQDYKATIVDKTVYGEKNKSDNLEWYKDEFKKEYEWNTEENKEIRTSDAVDNYDTRTAIDEQTRFITNGVKEIIEQYDSESDITVTKEDGSQETQRLITKMDSTTPEFRVNVEYNTGLTNAREEYQLDENGQIVMNGMYAVKAEGKENHVRNIDFGIVERARQVLKLDKNIKNAKIVLADGSVLINAEVEDGKLVGEPKHVVYIPESPGANGQVKFEIDSDIVQSARLEIEYGLTATNISEYEYSNEEFYHYGRGYGENFNELVTLKSTKVIDYLDDNIATDMSKNASWEVMQQNEARRELIDTGLLENTEEMDNLLKGTSKIVLTEELSQKLYPAESKVISLIGYKLLANNDETILENNAEIIRVEKSGGSTLVTTPGNYIPTSTSSEYDDDRSERVSVIPPTGLDIDYMAYTILAISSLGIIVAGIILIKKLVLRK